ncbi:hypothetical protein V6N13_089570 [Hibiscus sabdariffa]
MGGKTFLLSFEDEDVFIMLEDLKWAYLKEIFCNVMVWSEDMRSPNRATWIEVRGLPLHAWNGTSLKRIAELWGNFEACGENVNQRIDSEKTSILITTNHPGRIDEEIIVEVGSKSYVIHIFELGFKDVTLDPLIQANLKKVPATTVSSQSEDSSECSSSEERNGDDVEQPSLIVKVADKEDGGIIEQEAGMLKSQENEKVNLEPHGQEKTLDVEENLIKGLGAEEIVGQKNVVGQMSRSWAEVLTGGENNLGLTQTTGQKEESNQVLGQNGGNQKDKVFVENVGPLQKEVKRRRE